MISPFSFYFVRHGETDWNRISVYQGPNDIPLNAKGRQQAHALGKKIKPHNFKKIYASPLLRALETAEILRSYMSPQSQIFPVEGFKECRSPQSARRVLELSGVSKMPSFQQLREKDETPEQFFEKTTTALEHTLSDCEEGPPLIVAHGGISVAICKALNLPYFRAKNCCFIHFENYGHQCLFPVHE